MDAANGQRSGRMLYVFVALALGLLVASWWIGRRRRTSFYAQPHGDDAPAGIPPETVLQPRVFNE
jgi:hypothetical protein